DVGALSGATLPDERAQDGGGGVGAGEDVSRLKIGRTRRWLVALLEVHEARDGIDDVREGGPWPPGPRLGETRDRAVHEIGLHGAHGLVVAREPGHHARHEVLHHHVGHPGQAMDYGLALRPRQVDGHALLARVHPDEVRALIASPRLDLEIVAPLIVAFPRALDLGHARPEVGEQAGTVRSGQHAGEIEDNDAGQREIGHSRRFYQPAGPGAPGAAEAYPAGVVPAPEWRYNSSSTSNTMGGDKAHTKEGKMAVRIGDEAPDFTAETTDGPIRFHEWIGEKWAILFSHPKDFTPVCTTELGYMAGLKPEFDKRNTKILGLSIDPVTDHKSWVKDIQETQGHAVNYPIIGDADLT